MFEFNETKRDLIALAFSVRAKHQEEWGAGWYFRPGGWEFGPFFSRLWPWVVALKCAICILLGRKEHEGSNWQIDQVEIAAWDGEEHNGYPEANYHAWKYLNVRKGWRPQSWRYEASWEST